MKKLKIGIIGVGRLGYEHACNIANRVPGSELVAIADANFDRAKQVAEELGVTAVYNDPKALCADPNVEAVAIITNTASHVEMIKIAMDAGKHVFCEKPLADTVEKCKEAEAIIAAHPELTFMLGFMRRYDHSYQVAKKKMENGDIGDVILVRCYSQDPIEILKKHHDRIGHVHLKNVRKPAMDKCYAENKSFLRSIPEGVFTVPGDPEGCVDFPTVFKLLDEYNYEGWLVVEAEQDPAIANPLEYARMARAYVKEHTGL